MSSARLNEQKNPAGQTDRRNISVEAGEDARLRTGINESGESAEGSDRARGISVFTTAHGIRHNDVFIEGHFRAFHPLPFVRIHARKCVYVPHTYTFARARARRTYIDILNYVGVDGDDDGGGSRRRDDASRDR